MELDDALLQLEAAAAVVESFLPDELSQEQAMLLLEAWGPPRRRQHNARARELQAEDWIAWIRAAAGRFEARPAEPSADDLHRAIMRWVLSHRN